LQSCDERSEEQGEERISRLLAISLHCIRSSLRSSRLSLLAPSHLMEERPRDSLAEREARTPKDECPKDSLVERERLATTGSAFLTEDSSARRLASLSLTEVRLGVLMALLRWALASLANFLVEVRGEPRRTDLATCERPSSVGVAGVGGVSACDERIRGASEASAGRGVSCSGGRYAAVVSLKPSSPWPVWNQA